MSEDSIHSGPEESRLRARLDQMWADGMKNIHFTWGPEGADLDREGRCLAMNQVLDEAEKWSALPKEEQMRRQIADVYEGVLFAMKRSQRPLSEVLATSGLPFVADLHKRLSEVSSTLDMGILLLGNWIDNDQKAEIRARVETNLVRSVEAAA